MGFVMPLKAFAAGIFSGLMILYMITGFVFAGFTGEAFNYSIPFIFVFQGLILSILISILWGLFFSNVIIKKWRFFLRHIMFELSLLSLLAICFFTFLAIPTEWSKLWLIVAGILAFGVIILSSLSEMYFKKTGKHYTEMLKAYKATI
jgi:phosphatidylserine synthase